MGFIRFQDNLRNKITAQEIVGAIDIMKFYTNNEPRMIIDASGNSWHWYTRPEAKIRYSWRIK